LWTCELKIYETNHYDKMPSLPRHDSITLAPIDNSTNAPSILAINGAFCFFALVVVLARLYVRAVMLKHVGTDDYLITAAMVRLYLNTNQEIFKL
jgi:hypothetical protein